MSNKIDVEPLIDLLMPGLRYQEAALERAAEYLKMFPETIRKYNHRMIDDWKPIETIPWDEWVLLWSDNHKKALVGKWAVNLKDGKKTCVWAKVDSAYMTTDEATHWIPLPKPPVPRETLGE